MTEDKKKGTKLRWMNQISHYNPSHYIGTQSDLTQVMTLNKKLKAQPLRLIGHEEKEKVNYGEL